MDLGFFKLYTAIWGVGDRSVFNFYNVSMHGDILIFSSLPVSVFGDRSTFPFLAVSVYSVS